MADLVVPTTSGDEPAPAEEAAPVTPPVQTETITTDAPEIQSEEGLSALTNTTETGDPLPSTDNVEEDLPGTNEFSPPPVEDAPIQPIPGDNQDLLERFNQRQSLVDFNPDEIFGTGRLVDSDLGIRPDYLPEQTEVQVAGKAKAVEAFMKGDVFQRVMKLLKPGEENPRLIPEEDLETIRHHFDKPGYALGSELNGFNYTRFNTPGDIDQVMQQLIELHSKGAKKVRGFDKDVDINKYAELLGMSPARLLARRNNQAYNAAELKAANALVIGAMERLRSLHQLASKTDSTENLINLREHAAITAGMVLQLRGATAEAGRALRALRKDQSINTELGKEAANKELMDIMGGHSNNKFFMDQIGKFLDANDNAGALRFINNSRQAKTMDMMFESWINALLGSPATHVVNFSSNTLIALNQISERWVAGLYGNAEHVLSGRALVGQPIDGVSLGEARDYTLGALMGIWDFIKLIPDAAWGKRGTGRNSAQYALQKFNLGAGDPAITSSNIKDTMLGKHIPEKLLREGGAMARIVDVLAEWYFRMPGKALVTSDMLFQSIGYRAELHAQINRAIRKQGLKGQAALDFRKEALMNPEFVAPNLHFNSVDNARYSTLTNTGGGAAEGLNTWRNELEFSRIPIGKILIPFFRVINNLVKYPLHRMGLDLPRLIKDGDLKDPAQRALLVGRLSTSAAFLAGAATMTPYASLTGEQTRNPRMRRILDEQGKKAYNVIIPWSKIDPNGILKEMGLHDGQDLAYTYSRMAPFGMFLAIIAETRDIQAYVTDPAEQETVALQAAAAVSGFMLEQSAFLGVTQMLDAINPSTHWSEDRTRAFGRWISQLLATTPGAIAGPLAPGTPLSAVLRREGVPGVSFDKKPGSDPDGAQVEIFSGVEGDKARRITSVDPKIGGAAAIFFETINKIKNRTPGWSESLPAYRDGLDGEIVYFQGGLGPDAVSPIYTHRLTYNRQDLLDAGLPSWVADEVSFVGKRVDIDMSEEQWESFIRITGARGELERLGMPLNMPSRSLKGFRLDPKQYWDGLVPLRSKIKVNGKTMRETIEDHFTKKVYRNAPFDKDVDGSKYQQIAGIVRQFNSLANELLIIPHDLKLSGEAKKLMDQKKRLVPEDYGWIFRWQVQKGVSENDRDFPQILKDITFPDDLPETSLPEPRVGR